MQALMLLAVFAVIAVCLALKRPLWQAMLAAIIVLAAGCRIPPAEAGREILRVFTEWSSCSILVSLYLISLLQRLLDARGQIRKAQQDLDGLFHNRRVNAGGAPLFIGFMPSAAGMILCADMMKDAAGEYLTPREQSVAACWFRHIPESTLPTYTNVLLLVTLSGVPFAAFLRSMILPLAALAGIGWCFWLRKLPRDPGTPASGNRGRDAVNLLRHLWSLLAIVVLILSGLLQVVPAMIAVIIAAFLVYRVRPRELASLLASAFDRKLLLNSFVVLVLKNFIASAGLLEALPALLSGLPVAQWMIFALLFLLGGIVSGTTAIVALGMPLAFAALPDGGVRLAVLLACMCHAASMLSPTHVCLAVAADRFGVPLGAHIRASVAPAAVFIAFALLRYAAGF